MTGFAWSAPAALWLLVVPLALLLLARRRARPLERTTGTLELWRQLDARPLRRGRADRPLPPGWLIATASGLAALALALAGPVQRAPRPPGALTVVVDPDPALFVAWVDPSDGRVTESLRLARVLDAAEDWIAEHVEPGSEIDWRLGDVACGRGARPPREALSAARAAGALPFAASDADRPGVLFLTARAPRPDLQAASWIAAGGGAVVGPVGPAVDAEGRPIGLDFDGRALVAVEARGDALGLGPGLPEPVEALARAWATTRGLATVPLDAPDPIWLELLAFDDDRADQTVGGARQWVGRDGWSAALGAPLAGAFGPPPEGRVWLGSAGRPWVVTEPGRVAFAAREWSWPEGPATAFPLSLGGLFESACLAPDGRAGVAARAAAGTPASSTRALPAPPAADPRPFAAVPAVAAGSLLALAGLLLRRPRRG